MTAEFPKSLYMNFNDKRSHNNSHLHRRTNSSHQQNLQSHPLNIRGPHSFKFHSGEPENKILIQKYLESFRPSSKYANVDSEVCLTSNSPGCPEDSNNHFRSYQNHVGPEIIQGFHRNLNDHPTHQPLISHQSPLLHQGFHAPTNLHNHSHSFRQESKTMPNHHSDPHSLYHMYQNNLANLDKASFNHCSRKQFRTQNHVPGKINLLSLMEINARLGLAVDSSPPVPDSRQYSIVRNLPTRHGHPLKVKFPQQRMMKKKYTDSGSGCGLKEKEVVVVSGPSQEDRSKLTVCLPNGLAIDVPYQFFYPDPIDF